MKNIRNKKGFSLVELLIVIAILGLLAGIIIPSVTKYLRNLKEEYNKSLTTEIISIAKNYYSENDDKLPKGNINTQGLQINKALVSASYLFNNNYIKGEFKDSDGNSCINNSYVVVEKNNNDYDYTACIKCDNGYENLDENKCKYIVSNKTDNEVDNILPRCSLSLESGNLNKWTNEDVTLTLTLEDNTSVVGYYLSDGSFNKVDNLSNYTTSIKLSETMYDDSYYVIVEDQNANQGICKLDGTIMVDKEKPTCNLSVTTNGVSINTNDDGGSDVEGYDLTTNDSYSYNNTKTLELKEGIYYGYVKDKAGNINTCSASVTKPEVTSYTKTKNSCTRSVSSYTCRTSASYDCTYSSWTRKSSPEESSYDCSGEKYDTTWCYSCSKRSSSVYSCTYYTRTKNCSYSCSSGTRDGSYCYKYNQSSCGSWSIYKTNYNYYFNRTSETTLTCTSGSSFTCNSSNYGYYYTSCSAKYECKDSIDLNNGYCYVLN